MKKHPILERILTKYVLTDTALPENADQWLKFLEHINRFFYEVEQDRYLMERSQELSSQEMQNLFERLENAQQIAHLGSWSFNCATEKAYWSSELYHIMQIIPSEFDPTFQNFINFVHPDDKNLIIQSHNQAINQGIPFDIEIRVVIQGDIHWLRIQAKAQQDAETGKIVELNGTALDITDLKEKEESIKKLNEDLLVSAKQAGMAEVATSVLHNIGNVLNSVNITSSLVEEKINASLISNIKKVVLLLKENQKNLSNFLATHPQGKHIPEYLSKLSDLWEVDKEGILKDLKQLNSHIQHIKDIVNMQQSLSNTIGMVEYFDLPALIDNAINIAGLDKMVGDNTIVIERHYDKIERLSADKIKLLQILVNLFRNAIDAINENSTSTKKLEVYCEYSGNNKVDVKIKDSGIGIRPDELTKIFNYGFTTKANGHGFGLHISALSAHEMGGKLSAHSEGLGTGATFTLELPYQSDSAQPVKAST